MHFAIIMHVIICIFIDSNWDVCGFYALMTIVWGHYVLHLSVCLSITLKNWFYNQLLQFLSSHIEDVQLPFWREENHFWINYSIFRLWHFTVSGYYTMASLFNQLLQQFFSNQSETLRKCCRHIKDFEEKKYYFWQN